MTIVINTPNSHIGRRVTQRLLDSEIAVDIITRIQTKYATSRPKVRVFSSARATIKSC